jgi:hypothetical protein
MDRRTYISRSGVVIAGIFFSGSLVTFLDSCNVEKTGLSELKLLTKEGARLLASLSDMIIPHTDSPGASDVGVVRRIDEALYCNFEPEDQKSFTEGLIMISEYTKEKYSREFHDLDLAEKDEVMQYLIADAIKNKFDYKKHIYPLIKGLTIIAYFTSETIAKKLLVHDPIPGVFEGDIPYHEVGGIWSINIMDS